MLPMTKKKVARIDDLAQLANGLAKTYDGELGPPTPAH